MLVRPANQHRRDIPDINHLPMRSLSLLDMLVRDDRIILDKGRLLAGYLLPFLVVDKSYLIPYISTIKK